MVSKSQYGERDVKTCKAVLLEFFHLIGEIKDEVVLIGGWTPYFLFSQSEDPHIGSLDIDVALNFSNISDDTYDTINRTLTKSGYIQDEKQPFRFFRQVNIEGEESIKVEVDLMAGEYGGTGKRHRTQIVQDVHARKIRGCDLAFSETINVIIEGELPDGGKDKLSFKVIGIVSFIVMKGLSMYERMKEKDAYDIFYCIRHYSGGVEGLAEKFKPRIKNKLVVEGLRKLKSKFDTVEHVGPKWVADFLEITDKEDRDIVIRQVYEEVNKLLSILGISSWEE
jgi:hypothetical protein